MTAPSPDAPGQGEADAGGEVEVKRVLGAHGQSFGSNETDLWAFCLCSPNVVLLSSGGPDVPPTGSGFYQRAQAAFHDHLATRLVAAARADADATLGEVRALADGWVGFDDSHHYGDAVLKALGPGVLATVLDAAAARREDESP